MSTIMRKNSSPGAMGYIDSTQKEFEYDLENDGIAAAAHPIRKISELAVCLSTYVSF